LARAPDEEEADRREMAEIQDRMEARRAAKDLEVARATIKKLKSFLSVAPVMPLKTSKRATQRSKGESEKESGISRGSNKTLAKPSTRESIDSRGDDACSTLKFISIEKTGVRPTPSAEDMSSVELGIALVASALGKKVPKKSSGRAPTGMSGCYVDLASAQKKSRTPVFVAPPNSIDSDDLEQAELGSEVPPSHSEVHIGLPGDTVETVMNVRAGSEFAEIDVSNRIPGHGPAQSCPV